MTVQKLNFDTIFFRLLLIIQKVIVFKCMYFRWGGAVRVILCAVWHGVILRDCHPDVEYGGH
jgi:hypothetical protein